MAQATIAALLLLALPDTATLLVAFSAGVVAALGQAAIPYYIGKSIDFASIDPDPAKFRHGAVMLVSAGALHDIPGCSNPCGRLTECIAKSVGLTRIGRINGETHIAQVLLACLDQHVLRAADGCNDAVCSLHWHPRYGPSPGAAADPPALSPLPQRSLPAGATLPTIPIIWLNPTI